jgi:MFS family permease
MITRQQKIWSVVRVSSGNFLEMYIPFIFQLRRSLQETDEFLARRQRPRTSDLLRTVAANWRLVTTGIMMVTMTTVTFYFITAYTPTFGQQVLKLASVDSLLVTLCVGVSNLIWLVVAGALSDRIGRRPILITFTLLALATSYGMLSWLVSEPSFRRLLLVELWLSFIYGSYNGAMVVYLPEIMRVEVRTTAFSLAYSLVTAVFGGFTPAISTYLIHVTNNRAMPGVWLSFAAACGLTAVLLVKGRGGQADHPVRVEHRRQLLAVFAGCRTSCGREGIFR